MKKNIFILIIIGYCCLFFVQCKKKVGKNLGTISFTAQDLQIVPYNGGETITLLIRLGIPYNITYKARALLFIIMIILLILILIRKIIPNTIIIMLNKLKYMELMEYLMSGYDFHLHLYSL